jgi:hypothetical protein
MFGWAVWFWDALTITQEMSDRLTRLKPYVLLKMANGHVSFTSPLAGGLRSSFSFQDLETIWAAGLAREGLPYRPLVDIGR